MTTLSSWGHIGNTTEWSEVLTCCMLERSHQKQHAIPRLHAAFIDFSQAYNTVPCLQLWDHLQRIAMPAPLLRAIKEMYQDDGYFD
eukprot:1162016-Pelagomonas_calceolata.AAC.22